MLATHESKGRFLNDKSFEIPHVSDGPRTTMYQSRLMRAMGGGVGNFKDLSDIASFAYRKKR